MFSWYDKNPELIQAAARFPFPYRAGDRLAVTDLNDLTAIPGVMTLHWAPAMGSTQTYGTSPATAPVNIAAQQLFNRVRAAFSGSIEAEGADMLLYMEAITSMITYVAECKRIYRVATSYSPDSRVLPDVLLSALGCSAQLIADVKQNKTQLWGMINRWAKALTAFKYPKIFDLSNRREWMGDNVYTDADSIDSQWYAFVADYYFKFATPSTSQPAGSLVAIASPILAAISIEDLDNGFSGMYHALATWDDAFIISGYLQRAFSDVSDFFTTELAEFEVFQPRYEPEVLMQIENSTAVVDSHHSISVPSLNVTQDPSTGLINYQPYVSRLAASDDQVVSPSQLLALSIRSAVPSVEEVTEATRLHAVRLAPTAPTAEATIAIACGTEIPLKWTMTYSTSRGPTTEDVYQSMGINVNSTAASVDLVVLAATGAKLTNFDWCPFIYVGLSASGGVPNSVSVFGDMHNITKIDPIQLQKLHAVCLYSEYNAFGF